MKSELEALFVRSEATVRQAMAALDATARRLLLLVDGEGRLVRTVTDGDLRRLLLAGFTLDDTLSALPHRASVTAPADSSPAALDELFAKSGVDQIPLLDPRGRPVSLAGKGRDPEKRILLSSPHLGDEERLFIENALDTNWVAPLGPHVDAFERELAELVGSGAAAAVSSGTAAIHLALILLGVGRGDQVLCSSLTFVASANPILYQGAEPVFVDSEPGSWNMSPQALERALEAGKRAGRPPKAVVVVNLYGQSAEMDAIVELCEAYGVPLVEDAAESLGATYKGRSSGVFGKFGIYSFNGNKIITTSGGGMLISDDVEAIARARYLASQARQATLHYEHTEIGFNYRMSNILAGIGRGQLRVLAQRVDRRRRIFDLYREALAGVDAVEWMPEIENGRSTRWLTAMTVRETGALTSRGLIAALASANIEARPVWKPMHRQPLFEGAGYFVHGNESVSDRLFDHGVCLPSGSNLTDDEVLYVAETIRRYFA